MVLTLTMTPTRGGVDAEWGIVSEGRRSCAGTSEVSPLFPDGDEGNVTLLEVLRESDRGGVAHDDPRFRTTR